MTGEEFRTTPNQINRCRLTRDQQLNFDYGGPGQRCEHTFWELTLHIIAQATTAPPLTGDYLLFRACLGFRLEPFVDGEMRFLVLPPWSIEPSSLIELPARVLRGLRLSGR